LKTRSNLDTNQIRIGHFYNKFYKYFLSLSQAEAQQIIS
jgi:hypothetical protein